MVKYLKLATVWAIMALLLAPGRAAIDYCGGVKCDEGTHTMCKFADTTPGPECNKLEGQGMNKKQIQEMLHTHNRWRDFVAAGREKRTSGGPLPTAANMGVLTWDDDIAQVAQRWALQCHFGHDKCRNIPTMRVGQNVAMRGSSFKGLQNLTTLAWMWYNEEVHMFNAATISSFVFSSNTGHFSQWIWANSYKLGCGYSGYQDGGFHDHFLVCNYGPAGNVMSTPVYQQGKVCSACPEGTTCGGDARYPNLCSAKDGIVPESAAGPLTGGNQDNPMIIVSRAAARPAAILGPVAALGFIVATVALRTM
ncbi:venom allergen 5-like [Pollicipes pollicipes]|uniref:venom allergen 5-like n=1 Tax=Pollicipes pollicipes TaxID=41117 RepID=UPI0018858B1E|nr:venom allergen 5-like [Pollicipes pollicipes]